MTTDQRSILFADVCDSTRLLEAMGDVPGRAVLVACLAELQRSAVDAGGTVLSTIGDEVMVVFEDALSGARGACGMQVAVEDAVRRGALPAGLHVRIGFHYGPVVVHDEGLFGKTVHLARRVASASKAQQIVTSRQTLNLLPPDSGVASRYLERSHVKGHDDALEMHEILWDVHSGTLMDFAVPSSFEPISPKRLLVSHGERTLELNAKRPVATVGREEHCNLVIEHPRVSRLHGRFELRKNGYVFVDASANGTYVVLGSGLEAFVRRDETLLSADGVLRLGGNDAEAPVLKFTMREETP